MNRRLKTGILAIAAVVLSYSTAVAQRTFTPEELARQKALYAQVDGDIARGKFADAERKARALIAARPTDPYMRKLLVKVQTARIEFNTHSRWERKLKSLIVPDVNIDGATLEEVAEYLRIKAKQLSGGDTAPNIILRGSEMSEREVTLSLKNVPLSEVLRYAGQLADVRFAYEKHAIVGYDKRAPSDVADKKVDPASGGGTLEAKGSEFPSVPGLQAPEFIKLDEFLPGR